MSTPTRRTTCPPWCTRNHASITHSATIAEFPLHGMTVTIEVAHSERFDELRTFGPLTRIDVVTSDGTGLELDLTQGQVTMLTQILNADEGPGQLAEALTAAHTALAQTLSKPHTQNRHDRDSVQTSTKTEDA